MLERTGVTEEPLTYAGALAGYGRTLVALGNPGRGQGFIMQAMRMRATHALPPASQTPYGHHCID